MSSIYCLLDYPIISWAQISDQMRTASYFFRKTFPPNIWINSKFSNFLQIFLISAASSLLTGEESKCATHSYHLLQICHFLYFFGNFFTFQKRNVFAHNVFHGCIFPCEESFFQSHTKSYWQKLFFIFRGEESMCATHSSAATGLFFINDIFYISIKICHVFHISVNRFFRILLKRVSHFSGDLICPLSWSEVESIFQNSSKYFLKK